MWAVYKGGIWNQEYTQIWSLMGWLEKRLVTETTKWPKRVPNRGLSWLARLFFLHVVFIPILSLLALFFFSSFSSGFLLFCFFCFFFFVLFFAFV